MPRVYAWRDQPHLRGLRNAITTANGAMSYPLWESRPDKPAAACFRRGGAKPTHRRIVGVAGGVVRPSTKRLRRAPVARPRLDAASFRLKLNGR